MYKFERITKFKNKKNNPTFSVKKQKSHQHPRPLHQQEVVLAFSLILIKITSFIIDPFTELFFVDIKII